ncbi:MAG TPA: hypothetical protein PLO44_02355 [Candidatus Paceibacterota bacterium]|nr:hypothetical protein [Candidatus Paceibacterota bacterium]
MSRTKLVRTKGHHRRPSSLKGTDSKANISYVEPKLHENWHLLFGNLNAYQICELLQKEPEMPKGIFVTCEFINGNPVGVEGKHYCKNKNKRRIAWKILFGEMPFSEIISYINNVWLDPAYHFYF